MKEIVIYKIMNATNGKFASRHRGIDFVKGKGSSWSARHNLINSIVDALVGYCCSGNNICPNDLRVVTINATGIHQQTLKEFCSPEELETIRKDFIHFIARDKFQDSPKGQELKNNRDYEIWQAAEDKFATDYMEEMGDNWYNFVYVDKWDPIVGEEKE